MAFLDKVAMLFISDRDKRIKAIIHLSSIEAGAVGLLTAQIPGDRLVIGSIQIEMVRKIGSEYGKRWDSSTALGVIESVIATVVGVEVVNQIVKYVPVVGNIANTSVAASVTEAIGWATKKFLENTPKEAQ